MPNPMDGQADHGPPDDRQVQHGVDVADPAPVFAGDDIESEVKAGFNAPVSSVGLKHLLGIHLGGRAGTEQIFRFDFPGWFAVMVEATGQPGGLLGKREIDAGGAGGKGDQTAGFGATAVALTGLDDGRLVPRGKMRPTGRCRVPARWRRHRVDCL